MKGPTEIMIQSITNWLIVLAPLMGVAMIIYHAVMKSVSSDEYAASQHAKGIRNTLIGVGLMMGSGGVVNVLLPFSPYRPTNVLPNPKRPEGAVVCSRYTNPVTGDVIESCAPSVPGTPFVEVPKVAGLTLSKALDQIYALGLKYREQRGAYSKTVQKGLVVSTDPAIGTKAAPNTELIIFVSNGEEIKVPQMVHQTVDRAKELLTAQGFVDFDKNVTIEYVPRPVGPGWDTPGLVVRHEPISDTPASPDTPIKLYVSKR